MFNRFIFWLSCIAAAVFFSGLALWIVDAKWPLEGKLCAGAIWMSFSLIAFCNGRLVYESLD